ncbi:MAG: LuxR C-terminal-related transcriptional regulator [Weeksellaceae bacterium]|nr:LuxR C-terminal-related transcriptional regulator [Weeksellaceae bacterium]
MSGIRSRSDMHRLEYNVDKNNLPHFVLTPRELEILFLIAKGYNSCQIAEEIHISSHTVRTHRKNLLKKAQCRNSSELIRSALEKGLI